MAQFAVQVRQMHGSLDSHLRNLSSSFSISSFLQDLYDEYGCAYLVDIADTVQAYENADRPPANGERKNETDLVERLLQDTDRDVAIHMIQGESLLKGAQMSCSLTVFEHGGTGTRRQLCEVFHDSLYSWGL
jgi:hypothetical protein